MICGFFPYPRSYVDPILIWKIDSKRRFLLTGVRSRYEGRTVCRQVSLKVLAFSPSHPPCRVEEFNDSDLDISTAYGSATFCDSQCLAIKLIGSIEAWIASEFLRSRWFVSSSAVGCVPPGLGPTGPQAWARVRWGTGPHRDVTHIRLGTQIFPAAVWGPLTSA